MKIKTQVLRINQQINKQFDINNILENALEKI